MGIKARIDLKRNQPDRILPRDFFTVLMGQFFPILSITYVASVLAIAWYFGGGASGFAEEFLHNGRPYRLSLWIALWVSIPGFVWVCLKGSIRFPAFANAWYIVTALLMAVTLGVSFLLFPELDGNLRMFILCALPIHIFMYVFLCIYKLNQWIAQPFQILAVLFIIYGFII